MTRKGWDTVLREMPGESSETDWEHIVCVHQPSSISDKGADISIKTMRCYSRSRSVSRMDPVSMT